MKKRFKHKQTREVIEFEYTQSNCISGRNSEGVLIVLPSGMIEGSLDWEEVKEKTYEIISVKYIQNNKVYTSDGAGFRNTGGYISFRAAEEGNLLNPPQVGYEISIHSIKRLSDGEIFTLGDKIDGKFSSDRTILSFDASNKYGRDLEVKQEHGHISLEDLKHSRKEILYTTYDGVERYEYQREHWVVNDVYTPEHDFEICEGNIEGSLSEPETYKIFSTKEAADKYIESLPKPLFTTEDGKEMFEGDTYFCVYTIKGSTFDVIERPVQECYIVNYSLSYIKYFSTRALAEEFTLMHKPCLSLNDLLEVWGGGDDKSIYAKSILFNNFKRLAKNK